MLDPKPSTARNQAKGSPNWRFADTLRKDVLRSHPVSGKVRAFALR